MYSITIPIAPEVTRKEVEAKCKERQCKVTARKDNYYTIVSNDPVNFFWLGINWNGTR